MKYPIFSYDNGTEVTASKPNNEGKISLYIERFDEQADAFFNATILLPDDIVLESKGYNPAELEEMLREFSMIQDDIIGYVKEKEMQSA